MLQMHRNLIYLCQTTSPTHPGIPLHLCTNNYLAAPWSREKTIQYRKGKGRIPTFIITEGSEDQTIQYEKRKDMIPTFIIIENSEGQSIRYEKRKDWIPIFDPKEDLEVHGIQRDDQVRFLAVQSDSHLWTCKTITNLPNTVLGRWMWKTSVAASVSVKIIIR